VKIKETRDHSHSKAGIATEAFCTAGGGVNDDNGGTGGKVTANVGNVIGGGNVSHGGLGMLNGNGEMVNGNGGMESGGAGGSCFNARRLRTTGITPSDRDLSFLRCGPC
jgi:hypothetical protein